MNTFVCRKSFQGRKTMFLYYTQFSKIGTLKNLVFNEDLFISSWEILKKVAGH